MLGDEAADALDHERLLPDTMQDLPGRVVMCSE